MSSLFLDRVSIRYPIYNSKAMSLRNKIVEIGTGGKLGMGDHAVVTVSALSDVSIKLSDGDAAAIVGHNGAGKSTLLRTMAGIYTPDQGSIVREGSVATVFELGAGMDPELSGYENIVRMLMLLGNDLKTAENAIPPIEEFSELGEFLSLPVRTYSSGMTMRLMFAVATSTRPDILLLDEMFGTGDASFQTKAQARMMQLVDESDIFVFASHDHGMLKRLCNRFFKLEHGTLKEISSDEI